MATPVGLIILDGFGHSTEGAGNAIAAARTPTLDYLYAHYPHSLLQASGTAVGLPPGFMGNSEVGHITIGTGCVIEQPMTKLLALIASGTFAQQPSVIDALKAAAKGNRRIHVLGLLSDAGVHCHYTLLAAYANAAAQHGLTTFLHLFTDGRDTLGHDAPTLLKQLQTILNPSVSIASLIGRFYAMDRNNNYERTETAYELLIDPNMPVTQEDPYAFLHTCHQEGLNDQMIPPMRWDRNSTIKPGDIVIVANVRPERTEQLIHMLLNGEIPSNTLQLFYPINFNRTEDATSLISPVSYDNCLRSMLNKHNKTVLLTAESEKAAHVTRFLGTGLKTPLDNESFLPIPSIVTESYADYPRMSADTITYFIRHSFRIRMRDVYVANYANADMLGHTGDFQATVWAIECLDDQLALLYDTFVTQHDGILIIVGDHGNAEQMIDPATGQPDPRHTTNPVPLICTSNDPILQQQVIQANQLANVTPIVLRAVGIPNQQ